LGFAELTEVLPTIQESRLAKKELEGLLGIPRSLNLAITNSTQAVLCTYPFGARGAAEILGVMRTHRFAVTKRRLDWDVIETAGAQTARAEIKHLHEELEQRVERTSQLMAV